MNEAAELQVSSDVWEARRFGSPGHALGGEVEGNLRKGEG